MLAARRQACFTVRLSISMASMRHATLDVLRLLAPSVAVPASGIFTRCGVYGGRAIKEKCPVGSVSENVLLKSGQREMTPPNSGLVCP